MDKIDALLNERHKTYGDPVLIHARIAEVWSGICGHDIDPRTVPLMMAGLKLVRAQSAPGHADSLDDTLGYVEIARKFDEGTTGSNISLARPWSTERE